MTAYTDDQLQAFRDYAESFLTSTGYVLTAVSTRDAEGGITTTFASGAVGACAVASPVAADRVRFADAEWGPLTCILKLPYGTVITNGDRFQVTNGYLLRIRDVYGSYSFGTLQRALAEVVT